MEGKKCLGIVSIIKKNGWIIDLPYGKGFLPKTEALDYELDINENVVPNLNIGSYVIVTEVKNNTNSNFVQGTVLTMLPSKVNGDISLVNLPVNKQNVCASVMAIEKHGWIGSFGKSTNKYGIKAFVKMDFVPEYISLKSIHLVTVENIQKEGQLLICKMYNDSYLSFDTFVNIQNIIPGQLVECKLIDIKNRQQMDKNKDGIPVKKRKIVTDHSDWNRYLNTSIESLELIFSSKQVGTIDKFNIHNPCINSMLDNNDYNNNLNTNINKIFPYNTNTTKNELELPKFDKYYEKTFLARIIEVNIDTQAIKTFKLSILPNMIHLTKSIYLYSEYVKNIYVGKKLLEDAIVVYKSETNDIILIGNINNQNQEFNVDSILEHSNKSKILCYCKSKDIAQFDNKSIYNSIEIGQRVSVCITQIYLPTFTNRVSMHQNYIDKNAINYITDCYIGQKIIGKVLRTTEKYAEIEISPKLKGYIYANHIIDSPVSELPKPYFKNRTTIGCNVFNIDYDYKRIYLICKPSMIDMDTSLINKLLNNVEVNDIYTFLVQIHTASGMICNSYGDTQIFITHSTLAKDNNMNLDSIEFKKLLNSKKYMVGACIKVKIININISNGKKQFFGTTNLNYETSLCNAIELEKHKTFIIDQSMSIDEICKQALKLFAINSTSRTQIVHISNVEPVFYVELCKNLRGELHLLNSVKNCDDGELLFHKYKIGQFIDVRIVAKHTNPLLKYKLFLQVARADIDFDVYEKNISLTAANIEFGKYYNGVVRHTSLAGILIDLGCNLTGRLLFKDIVGHGFDEYINRTVTHKVDLNGLLELFPKGKYIKNLRVTKIEDDNRLEVSLKTDFDIDLNAKVNWSNIQIKDIYPAKVIKRINHGIIVRLEDSCPIDALCINSNICDDDTEQTIYNKDDLVLVKVLRIARNKRKCGVGIKSSIFTTEELNQYNIKHNNKSINTYTNNQNENTDTIIKQEVEVSYVQKEIKDSISSDEETCADIAIIDKEISNHTSSFSSDNDLSQIEVEEFADNTETIESGSILEKYKAINKNVKLLNINDTAQLSVIEQTRIAGDFEYNIADLEKLVLMEGTKAISWIHYIMYYYNKGQVDEAINIGKRGVLSLPFEYSDQKAIIWKVLLNVALISNIDYIKLHELINQSLVYCDHYIIYNHLMLRIIDLKKWNVFENLKEKIIKKQTNYSVWRNFFRCLYESEDKKELKDSFSKYIQRAETLLSKKENIQLQVFIIRCEYKYGSIEEGRAKLLTLINERSKRLDIWTILIDLQLNFTKTRNEITFTRNLFNLLLNSGFKLSMLQNLLQKWLQFETKYGNTNSLRICKNKINAIMAEQS